MKSDALGDYLQVAWPFATYNQLNFQQLYDRVSNKIAFLDHVGVNMNPRLLSKAKYAKMKKMIASASCLYDYPFGKEWPFIIPASKKEQEEGIKTRIKRDPKFEFVYDFEYLYPEIQLDIQTILSPKETLAIFPPPYGFNDPNPITGDYCSSIFIYTGWKNVSLRIDLRFNIPNANSTDWLINYGKKTIVSNSN